MQIDLSNGYLLQDWETAWRDGDQERFVPLADDYEVWRNLSDSFSHPYTRANAEAWAALHAGVTPVVDFAVCDADGPIGGIGFETFTDELRHSAALGYWLGRPFWGRGIMSAAVKADDGLRVRDPGLRSVSSPGCTRVTTRRRGCWRRRGTGWRGCFARRF